MDNVEENNIVVDARQMIAEAGLRSTSARLAVLNVLIAAKSALSHAEIIEHLSAGYHFDRVTVYRVLDWLTEMNMIHRIPNDDRASKFQVSLTRTSHQHAHLHCMLCHKIICLEALKPSLSKQVTAQFQIESVDMIIKGRCESCIK